MKDYWIIHYKMNKFKDPVKVVFSESEAVSICTASKGLAVTEKSYYKVSLK